MSTIRSLASQTAIYGISSIVGRFLNYLLVPVYTRVFVPEAYGVISEFYAYTTFLLVLFTYGMETAFFHFSEKNPDKAHVYRNSFSLLCITSVILSSILILFSQPIANVLGYQKHAEYVTWFAMILAFDAVTSISFTRLRQQNKPKKFALYKTINIVINISLNIFFLVFAKELYEKGTTIGKWLYNPAYGVGYVFISNLVASGVTVLLFAGSFKDFTTKLDGALLKKMFFYALPLMIAGFAGMINETLDRAIYKYLIPDRAIALHQLGIYSACYKVSIFMMLFIQTFRYASEPFFFAQQNKENSRQLYAKVMNYFVAICCFIFLGVMLYIDFFMHFIGESYREGVGVVPVLLFANLCLGIYINLSIWYKLSGDTHFGAWFSMIGAVITIVLLITLVPLFGYMGAAWATLICYASIMLISFVTGQKKFPIPYQTDLLLLMISMSLLFYFVSSRITGLFTSFLAIQTVKALLLLIYIGGVYKLIQSKNKITGASASSAT